MEYFVVAGTLNSGIGLEEEWSTKWRFPVRNTPWGGEALVISYFALILSSLIEFAHKNPLAKITFRRVGSVNGKATTDEAIVAGLAMRMKQDCPDTEIVLPEEWRAQEMSHNKLSLIDKPTSVMMAGKKTIPTAVVLCRTEFSWETGAVGYLLDCGTLEEVAVPIGENKFFSMPMLDQLEIDSLTEAHRAAAEKRLEVEAQSRSDQ